jgi:hypothetical protein
MKAADKIKAAKMRKISQKESEIDSMSNDQIKDELRNKKLQIFGTNQERKDRLKRYHGIRDNGGAGMPEIKKKPAGGKSNVVDKIKEMEEKRNIRRK